MGSLFRSEEMQLSQMFLHTDIAYMCISELGELGLVQFRDTVPGTNAFQRKFVNEVRRCDEMERKLRFLEKEIEKDKFPILDTGENPEAPAPREIIDLESIFEKLENELKEVNSSAEKLKKTYLELSELKQILRKTQTFFDEANVESHLDLNPTNDPNHNYSERDVTVHTNSNKRHVEFLAGIILRERLPAFERMLWRVCRGNVFLKQAEVDDPLEDLTTGMPVHKSVFLVFFQGDQLRTRVKKICDGFHATLYPCPDSQADRRNMAIEVMGQIQDLETVLTQTRQHRQRILETAAKNLRTWFIRVRKIKAIYHTLNLFNLDVTTKCMVGECWCAVNDVDKINLALRRGMERSNSTLQPILNGIVTTENPPTYHRTNKFTYAFQSIIDAYGVARYREVNPALFTVITFPFLFAVMFGDAGHGLLMFLFALWMVVCERKLSANKSGGEIWNIFFNGRYIILLMGLFSIYTGLIYNDIFSLSANIFGSSWYPTYDNSALSKEVRLQLEPRTSVNVSDRMYAGYPYPFGLDPVWQLSGNKIMLTNSIKMKMSVVLGVLHMLLGISLGAFNYRNNKDNLSIWCLLLPQILFLSCIFLYLVMLIFFKWVAYTAETASSAPSLLIGLINMIRFSYSDEIPPLYSGQKAVQSILMVIAVICVPWMLLSKPLILYMRHRAIMKALGPAIHPDVSTKSSEKIALDGNGLGDGSGIGSMDMPVESFDFGDIMVHQSIHTIEFCLGCISNTASYLRLWALSLAHAQLSEVLWSMVMRMGLRISGLYGGVVLAFIFAFWAVLTVSILLCMEGLSAFLHTLRLHWVEFQNKFYSGDGYPFVPFSFEHSSSVVDN
ncbi:unnamed protein product [Schistosoma margrebowiei]|uniref:V-type proton ATPase subunit a n=1 Tax=Schistosoma margrebowiei TaxID=48269 RepID=A0AA84ZLG4_9TREM|nr:unnamed protein product [Schistosoma margrebowiei]